MVGFHTERKDSTELATGLLWAMVLLASAVLLAGTEHAVPMFVLLAGAAAANVVVMSRSRDPCADDDR